MAKIDIKSLSLKELNALKTRVEKAIATHDKKQKAEALAAVKAKAKQMGYSLSDLTGQAAGTAAKKARKTVKKAKITHRDPENSENTWGGRGPRPAWLQDAMAAGKSPDDFKL